MLFKIGDFISTSYDAVAMLAFGISIAAIPFLAFGAWQAWRDPENWK